MNTGHRHEADRTVSGQRGHQEQQDRPRTDHARSKKREDRSSAAHGGTRAARPQRDLRGFDGPLRAIFGVSKPDEGRICDHRQETQGADRTDHDEAVAEESEDRGKPLVLLAFRGLVDLLSGQDATGQSDRRACGQVTTENSGAVEGTPIGVGDTHGGKGQIDLQHGAQARDRRPFGSREIGGAIGVDNGHGHHGGAHETSDPRETTVLSVMH